MADNFFRVKNGLNLPTLAADPTVTPPTNSQPGDMAMYNGDLYIRQTSAWSKALIGLIDTAGLEDDAVTADKLADNAVVNANVDAAAAIAGTKISPNFGAQNVLTTGNVGIGTASPEYKIDVTAVDNVTTTTAFSVQNSSRNYGLGLGAYTLTNRNIGGSATSIDYTFDIGGAAIFKTADQERMRINANGVTTFYGYARIESPAQSASAAGNETIDCLLKSIALKTGGAAEITLNNLAEGQTFTLVVTSTGSAYTITWSPTIKWPSGIVPSPSENANSRDIYTFTKIGGEIFGTVAKDMR